MISPPIILRPSAFLSGLLIVIYSGAACCVGLSSAPIWLITVMTIFILYGLILALSRTALLKHSSAVIQFCPKSNGEWLLTLKDGLNYSALLQGNSLVTSNLSVLNFKSSGILSRKTVIVVPSNVDQGSCRQLYTYLRTTRNICSG